MSKQDELEQELLKLQAEVDRIAENYATDMSGQFDHNAFVNFRDGFSQGLAIALQFIAEITAKNSTESTNH